jgi:hypothetical protein
MQEEENTNIRVALPGGRKLYVLACVIYGLSAISTISNLRPSAGPYVHQPSWHWTIWLDIWAEAWCIYFLFEMFSAVSNSIDKAICILTIIWFALAIPESLYRLGHHWAQVSGGKWIDLVVVTVAAFLVFLRTFQVFEHREA